jgi:hypothetical protein
MQFAGVRRGRLMKKALNSKFRRHGTFSQDHASQATHEAKCQMTGRYLPLPLLLLKLMTKSSE